MAQLRATTKEIVPGSFDVSSQDFRTHRFGEDPPRVAVEQFKSEEEALRRRKELQAMGLIACVTPTTVRKRVQQ